MEIKINETFENNVSFNFLLTLSKRCLNFESKIFLTLRWIAKYERYSTLSDAFGVSYFVVSKVIHEVLPILVSELIKYIPNKIQNSNTSSLSSNIVCIIDGTIHPISKPNMRQRHYFRGDKGVHFIQTLLLVDFNNNIIAVATGFPGSNADSSCARNTPLFKQICNEKFALGDPGFGNVSYVIPGLKQNQLSNTKLRKFDKISRSEQKHIE